MRKSGAWASWLSPVDRARRASDGVDAEAGQPAGGVGRDALRSESTLLWGLLAFAGTATVTVLDTVARGRGFTVLALLIVPISLLLRRRPAAAAFLIVVGGAIFRLAYTGLGVGDQVTVAQAAAQVALDGENPYGRGYRETVPPGAPYPYGPLGLVWWLPGVWTELAASVATLLLAAKWRAWLTLGLLAGTHLFAAFSVYGGTDASPAFFITAGLLALRERPLLGALLLAIAAGLKPYAFAWFPGAIAYGGVPALVGTGVGTALLWSPLLVWGPLSFLRSVEMAENLPHHLPNAANVPVLRVLAVPLALATLLVRRWEWAVVSGAVIFLTVLFLARWAGTSYLLAVIPILAITLEAYVLPRFLEQRAISRRASEADSAEPAAGRA